MPLFDCTYMVEYHVTPKTRLKPVTIAACNTIGGCESRRHLKVCFDSERRRPFLSRRALTKHARPVSISRCSFSTLAGRMDTPLMIKMRDVRLPEFNKNRSIIEYGVDLHDYYASAYLGRQI